MVAFEDIIHFFLCFIRILGILAVAPMFSQRAIFPQAKASLAGVLALLISPIVAQYLPEIQSASYYKILFFIFCEFSIGLLIGISGYFLFMILDFIGHILSLESGLSNAQLFNPSVNQTTAITTTVLVTAANLLLFIGDFHHTIIHVLVKSYEFINFEALDISSDFYTVLLKGMERMFVLGLQFSFPFILIGLVMNMGIGLVNKLIPQIHIFSIMPPLQLLVFFVIFSAMVAHLTDGFCSIFKETYTTLVGEA